MNRSLIVLLAVLFVAVSGGIVLRSARERARRRRCMAPLQCCFRKTMRMYAMDHDGAFPPDFASLAEDYAPNPRLYACPSSGTVPGSITNVDEWMDYIYIYWPEGEKTPTNYPWIYERRLSHHGGGIHVAPIRGPAFWDEGAKWLRKFAEEHPDLDIPIPEDLE